MAISLNLADITISGSMKARLNWKLAQGCFSGIEILLRLLAIFQQILLRIKFFNATDFLFI